MGQSYSNIKELYSAINTIDGAVGVEKQKGGGIVEFARKPISEYCPYRGEHGNFCINFFEYASCGVIYLLKNLKNYGLDYDKLAEYAILWLSYKLNQHPEYSGKKLNDIYTNNIGKNDDYNKKKYGDNSLSYKDIMDKKKDLMNMNIKEISNFYEALKNLYSMYSDCNKTELDCEKFSQKANEFVQNFEELNKYSKNIKNSSYSQILYRLSDDYNNLINKYDNKKSCDFSSLPKIKTSQSTLIPVLSPFSVIPVFLGVAYKTIYKKKIKKNKEENET
ncbi:PIR protein CIR protein [Plasmodium vinckei vinckei]|uniref:PIR protein CIR protein n=1 Tax=Plasmodium vinckei vinckei TaxID=54757 RepID=A0A449BNR8_PLAVN|nr:PIR protein CIR protein [Plasmodium vinckei vinckei]VEV55101.1 PIR protein CIR protein [Plasmodium vinckei vinckei]